jgi:hypothetical protein
MSQTVDFADRVIKLLQQHAEGLTAAQVAQGCGENPHYTGSRLSKLAAYGRIGRLAKRPGNGHASVYIARPDRFAAEPQRVKLAAG